MSVKLKPCPFPHPAKRGPFVDIDDEDFMVVRVACSDCGCCGPYVNITGHKASKVESAEAVYLWNARSAA